MSKSPTVFVGGPFSAAMNVEQDGTFDRRLRGTYELLHDSVSRSGACLLSAHLADHYGTDYDERSFVARDRAWCREADLFIALLPLTSDGVPYRSDGTFIELGLSIAYGNRVLLVVENLAHSSHSYFIRNLATLPEVRITDWDEFFEDPDAALGQALTGIINDPLLPESGVSAREQTTDPDDVLGRLALQANPDRVSVRGKDLTVLPGVFSPRFSHAPDFIIDNMQIPEGATVLDVGCGTGILGLFAMFSGASRVTSLDRNPIALENTRLNFQLNGFDGQARVLQSDVYSALEKQERFDVILLSPPYWDRPAHTALDGACFDEGYRFLRAAFLGLTDHLKPDGSVFVGFSNQGDVSLVSNLIDRSGLTVRRLVVQSPTMHGGHVRLFWHLGPA